MSRPLYLGAEESTGSIEKGMAADLVLLDADPLADIRNTSKIDGVFVDGKYLSKARLAALLRPAAPLNDIECGFTSMLKTTAVSLSLSLYPRRAWGQIYKDPNQPVDKRVDDLLSRMTLEEKASQLLSESPPIDRLAIPAYDWWNECLHGVARAGVATVFPETIGIAATWDTGLLFRVATAISDEARAKHEEFVRRGKRGIYQGLTFWTPNINIFRDPRWGRGMETYGEDPYLTGRMAVQFIRGLQGDDPKYLKTVATAKHYAVHSGPESTRHTVDVVVDEHDLRDTYLPQFEAAIREGGALFGHVRL